MKPRVSRHAKGPANHTVKLVPKTNTRQVSTFNAQRRQTYELPAGGIEFLVLFVDEDRTTRSCQVQAGLWIVLT
jgi:hypothetical protein